MKIKFTFIISILTFLFCLSGCKNDSTPKPIGYNRINIPAYRYIDYTNSILSIQYSELARIQTTLNKDSLYWFNILYLEFNATIYCSYIHIKPQTLKKVLDDTYHLAYSHAVKAEGIEQDVYEDLSGRRLGGIMYKLEGDVATPVQFFITDSTSNFFRGSFYYNNNVNLDSIKPITEVIKKDIMQLFNTLKFKKKQ